MNVTQKKQRRKSPVTMVERGQGADPFWVFYADYYVRDQYGKRRRIQRKVPNIVAYEPGDKRNKLAEAEAFVAENKRLIQNADRRDVTIEDAFAAFIKNRKGAGVTERWLECLGHYKAHLEAHIGPQSLFMSITDSQIIEYKARRKRDGIAAPTVNKELNLLRGAGEFAVKKRWIPRLPWLHIDRVSDLRDAAKWDTLTSGEVRDLLNFLKNGGATETTRYGRPLHRPHAPNPELWAKVVFALNTEARKGEMLRLTWKDVAVEDGFVRIVSTKSARNGKAAEPRHIPINAALREVFALTPNHADARHVFTPDANLLTKFQRALRNAGIHKVRWHDLRHTFASHLVMNGTPLYHVKELLGHSTIDMTQRYSHLEPERLRSAVDGLNFEALDGAEIVAIRPMTSD